MHYSRRFFLAFLILLLGASVTQGQKLDWQRIDENQSPFGFIGYQGARSNVAIDGAGNVITCAPYGNRVIVDGQEYPAFFETVIVKRNTAGQVLWSRPLTGSGFRFGHTIHADSVGNIYLLGWYYGNCVIAGTPLFNYGNYDCFLLKLNPTTGAIMYIRTLGSSGYDYPMGLDTDAQGNVYVFGKYAFSIQSGTAVLTGSSNSHYLLKLNAGGTLSYFKNICINGGTDWGRGGISYSSRGKLAIASNYAATSSFQSLTLTGSGGYLAFVDPVTGDVESVYKAGSEAWLVDHEPGGNAIVLGLHQRSGDSIANKPVGTLAGTSQLYLARVLVNGSTDRVLTLPNLKGSFGSLEVFRNLHVSKAGQIYLAGDLESPVLFANNSVLSLNLPHAAGRPQAVLAKLDEDFECRWFAGAGSRDTLGIANRNFGTGVSTDPQGNVVWGTMNDAYSVDSTVMIINNDNFVSGVMKSRYKAHGIHIWKFSEPSIVTLAPTIKAYCLGDSVKVQFQKFGDLSGVNRFQLQMSDSSGGFTSPKIIAETTDTNALEITGRIPFETISNSRYRFRVNAIMPDVRGSITDGLITIRSKPNADAGADGFFCLGDTLQLVGKGTGTLQWQNDQTVLSTIDSILIVKPDTHARYVLKVVDLLSPCVSFDTVSLRFRDSLKIAPLVDRLVCRGERLIVTPQLVFGDSNGLMVQWFDSNGTRFSTDKRLDMVVNSKQKIKVVVWDNCSLFSDTQVFQLLVRDPLKLNPIADTLICANSFLRLSASATGGDPSAYAFRWSNASFSSEFKIGVNFDTVYSQSLTLGLTVKDGCTAIGDSILVNVLVAPRPVIVDFDTTRVCFGDTVYLSPVVNGGYPRPFDYSWDGNPFLSTPEFSSLITLSRSIPLIVRDFCGLFANASAPVKVRQPVTLAIRADTILCVGERVKVYVSGTEIDPGHYSFFWNGETTSRNYYADSPSVTSRYVVRMVNVCDGAESFDSFSVFVRDPLSLSLSVDTPYCYGQVVTFTPQFSGGYSPGHALEWKRMDGTRLSNANAYQMTVRDSFFIKVVFTDGCTVKGDSITTQSVTLPRLRILQQADTQLCHNQNLVFVPSFSGGRGFSYRYTTLPTDSASLRNGTLMSASQQINIVLSDGCSESVSSSFRVNVGAPLQVSLPNDTALCTGSRIDLKPVFSGGIPSSYGYSWQGSARSNPDLLNQEIRNDQVFVFCLFDGCSAPSCDSVNIAALPLPDAGFSYVDTLLCVPGGVMLNANFIGANPSFRWLSQELNLDTNTVGPDLFLETSRAGRVSLNLRVIDANGCADESGSVAFNAVRKPTADFTLSDTVANRGELVKITLLDRNLATSYWNQSGLTLRSPGVYDFIYQDTGTLNFEHIAVNTAGCSDTANRRIWFKEPFRCEIPNAFNPTGAAENRVFRPVCENWDSYEFMIYNRWGQLVFKSDGKIPYWDGTYMGKGEELPQGIYVYVLRMRSEFAENFNAEGTVLLIR